MPAVPKPAEPCALRARSWTLSLVSPHPPGVGSGQPPEAQEHGPQAAASGQRTDRTGGLGCGVRDLWLLASGTQHFSRVLGEASAGFSPRGRPQISVAASRRFPSGVGGAAQPRAGWSPPHPRSSEKRGCLPLPYTLSPEGSLSSVCKFTTRYLSCFSRSECG